MVVLDERPAVLLALGCVCSRNLLSGATACMRFLFETALI